MKVINRFVSDYVPDFEIGGGALMVDDAGYIPKEEQLRNLVRSGNALEEYTRKAYPSIFHSSPDEADDPAYDPTLDKGYDYFDNYDNVTIVRAQIKESERLKTRAAEIAERGKELIEQQAELEEQIAAARERRRAPQPSKPTPSPAENPVDYKP